MKKAIRAIVIILVASLCAVSCKKFLQTVAIAGEWQVVRIVETVDGKDPLDTPELNNYDIFYKFETNGYFIKTRQSRLGLSSHEDGTWFVDGDTLLLRFVDGTETYHLERTSLLELVFSYSEILDGHKYTYTYTLKHI